MKIFRKHSMGFIIQADSLRSYLVGQMPRGSFDSEKKACRCHFNEKDILPVGFRVQGLRPGRLTSELPRRANASGELRSRLCTREGFWRGVVHMPWLWLRGPLGVLMSLDKEIMATSGFQNRRFTRICIAVVRWPGFPPQR